jgi:hypothetical protein
MGSNRECSCQGFCKGRDGLSARYVCGLDGKPGKVGVPLGQPKSLGGAVADWKQAALRLGEELSTNGPNGYYEFTPEQWFEWAKVASRNRQGIDAN